jgi:hypothetical protein
LALTKVTSGVRTLGAGEVATANMAVDPTNASNLSSGSVPLAQLGLAPSTDTTTLEDDIALLGFKVAANGSLAKYNLVDQTEDAFMDATGIDAVASTGETRNASNYYSGGGAPSGGTKTTYSSGGTDYTVHTFTSTGTYTSLSAINVDYFIVAGGGSGGGAHGGAGAAGGYLTAASYSLPAGTYTATIGTGGVSVTGSGFQHPGVDGLDTTFSASGFSTLTALKGGAGAGVGPAGEASSTYHGAGGSGTYGSGGGGCSAAGSGGVGTAGQGNAGGGGNGTAGASNVSGGGGGGGGGAGAAGSGSGVNGGNGGTGIQNLYQTGANQWYVGGGGGRGSTTGGTGGSGVGGAGGSNVTPTAGATNTGSGGGGAQGASSASGAGADGIVIIRMDSSLIPGGGNMVLQSNATTAETAPTKGDIVMTYTNGVGTATLNTDLTAEFSANDGGAWTSMTLVAQGTTGSASPHFIVSAHNVTLATASGTAMRYRIKTLNQSAAKETRIQAVSLGWS